MSEHQFQRRAVIAAVTAAATVATFLAGVTKPAAATVPDDPTIWPLYAVAPCDPAGPTANDGAIASQLNPQLSGRMRGHLDAYRISCARMVVSAVRARNLASRAAVIAITTTIVESTIQNISEEVDHDSLGLFQQRASWGTRAQRLDPTWATNAFLNKMLQLYPNNSWMTAPIGEVCQAVQVSAFPGRYQPEAPDAQRIVDALWNVVRGGADLNGDGHADILSVYASAGELVWYPWAGGGFLAGRGIGNAGGFAQLELGDVDNNGRKDMVALLGDGQLVWYPNIGNPSFLAARQLFASAGGFKQFAMGDVNNDGWDDIVALYHSGELVWYGNLGNNTFFRAQQIFPAAGGFKMFEIGQMNGVGADDILAVYTSGELVWYPNQSNAGPGNPGFLAARQLSNAGGFKMFGFADLDRDNRDDMVAVLTGGQLMIYTNNGGDNFYAARQVGNAPNFRLMDI